jgi:hypothetical protein
METSFMRTAIAGLLPLMALFLFHSDSCLAQCTIVQASQAGAVAAPQKSEISFDLAIDSISLSSVSLDSFELKLEVRFFAAKEARVRGITFANLRLNDMPLYAAPIAEPIRVAKKEWTTLPHPLSLVIYYRDLETLRPLEVLLSENRVRVQGVLYADVELNLLQKAVLLSRGTRVPISFSRDAAFEVPAGAAMRALALKMVRSAADGLDRIGSGLESAASVLSKWRQDLWSTYAPSTLMGYVRFNLRGPHGEIQQIECTSTGFRTSAYQFVLQKSLLEPWRFDPEIAAAVQRERYAVDKESYDVLVWPANAKLRTLDRQLNVNGAFSISKKQIRIAYQPPEETESLLIAKSQGLPRKINVLKREAAANTVLLEFTDSTGRMPAFDAKLCANAGKMAWDRLAIFRYVGGIDADEARPQLMLMPAKREGPRILLDGQIDWSGWGSPLISQDGVVGIVQYEKTGIALDEAIRALKQ